MKRTGISQYFWLVSLFLMFVACQNQEEVTSTSTKGNEVEFDIIFPTRADGDGNVTDYREDLENYFGGKNEEDLPVLLVSQRTGSMLFNFEEGSPNRFKYYWTHDKTATWESGYNFKSDNPLNWDRIQGFGPNGSTFDFAALFFPRDYEYSQQIESDQSNDEDFMSSDVLGALHTTSALYDRLRFRLYHLMSKMRIVLYIPKYDKDSNTGFTLGIGDVDGWATQFRTDYSVEWGDMNSDLKPVARPVSTSDNINVADIKMNRKTLSTDKDWDNFTLDLTPFSIMDMDEDNVYKFTFEVILPQQEVPGDFLRFSVRGQTYIFSMSNQTQGGNSFKLTSGNISQVRLYLPRTDNRLVLLKATILDWDNASADFTITPDE